MKIILLGLVSVAVFTSCNTTIGLGRDMRVLGAEMEKKADEVYGGGSSDEYSAGGVDDYSGGAPVY